VTSRVLVDSARALILAKLGDGCLPNGSTLLVSWGEPANGETYVGCDQLIRKSNFVMQGVADDLRSVQFHVTCFSVWDSERHAPGSSEITAHDAAGDGTIDAEGE
jgi:hypothetical protein